jgi:HAD superfamily hydrolase (TIGR01509 family)
MRKISAVVLDVDGTMIDSEKTIPDIWCHTLAELGYDMPTFHAWYYKYGHAQRIDKTFAKMVVDFNMDITSDKFFRELTRQRDKFYIHTPPAPKQGLFKLLDFCRENKIALGVCSSGWDIEQKLPKCGVPIDYFSTFVDGRAVVDPKPAPECYLLACKKLGVDPAEAIAVEDSDMGVTAAYSAGMRVVLIPDRKANEPAAVKMAWKKLGSLDEIIPFIKESIKEGTNGDL